MQRILNLLRTDKVDVAVKAARRQNTPLTGNNLGPRSSDHIHARLRIRVACLANFVDAPILQTHIRLVDAGVVDNQRVGDDGIDRPPARVVCACPMPSRITLPPPNLTSSP